MHRIENMTDPENRRSQARLHRQPVLPQGIIEQPNFGLELAAQIPEVHIPEHINAPRQFPMPVIPPLGRGNPVPAPGIFGALVGGAAVQNNDDPFAAGVQIRPIVGWRDMVAQLPPMPARRGRGRPRRVSGPRNVLGGPQANVDLNNVHRGQIAHREQVENHRVQLQARLEEQRQRHLDELERQAEIQRQNEQRQQELELEQQRQRDLAWLQIQEMHRQAEIQRQLALELENLNDVDDFQPPEANAQVRNLMHDQWRAEHERELDPDLNDIDFDDFDDFDVDDWQRLDDAIAQAFPLNEQQEADVHEANRRFENELRRDRQNHQDDVPDVP